MELNTLDILKLISNDQVARLVFLGVFARDKIPLKIKYPSCFIINTHTSSKQGEHWLSIYYNKNGEAEFFDSYGNHPSYYQLESYLDKTSSKWTYNRKQIQSVISDFCGHYCVLFILHKCRNMSLDTFISKFSDSTIENDLLMLMFLKYFY